MTNFKLGVNVAILDVGHIDIESFTKKRRGAGGLLTD